jgi:hypothetical protein
VDKKLMEALRRRAFVKEEADPELMSTGLAQQTQQTVRH